MDIISEGRRPCVIGIRGRFDANEVEEFVAFVDQLTTDDCHDFSIDLSAVNFIDSSALASLVRLSKQARSDGRIFELRDPSDPVRVILELTGLDKAFAIRVVRDRSGAAT